jgi:hypothetical protein
LRLTRRVYGTGGNRKLNMDTTLNTDTALNINITQAIVEKPGFLKTSGKWRHQSAQLLWFCHVSPAFCRKALQVDENYPL